MRKLLFFFLLTVPFLGACESFGLHNPQSEWTTTEGVGDQPPVSNIQGTVDWDAVATAADIAADAANVAAHEARHEEREARRQAAKPSSSSDSGRRGKR